MCINLQRLLGNTYFILQIAANKLAIIRSAEKFSALRLKAQPGSMIDIVSFKHVFKALQSKINKIAIVRIYNNK